MRKSNCDITDGIHLIIKSDCSAGIQTVVWHFHRDNHYSCLFIPLYFSWAVNGRLDLLPAGVNKVQIKRCKTLCQKGTDKMLSTTKSIHFIHNSLLYLSSACQFLENSPSIFCSHVGVAKNHIWVEISDYLCFAELKEKPFHIHVNNRGVLEENSASEYKTSVVGNSTDKIYNKHAKVLQPPSHVQLQRVGESTHL